MNELYRATVYVEEKAIACKADDDIEQLYIWMLAQANSFCGNVRGEIVNNNQEIIRKFKKRPTE